MCGRSRGVGTTATFGWMISALDKGDMVAGDLHQKTGQDGICVGVVDDNRFDSSRVMVGV